MLLPTTLISLLLSLSLVSGNLLSDDLVSGNLLSDDLVSGNLLSDDQTIRRPRKSEPVEEGRKTLMRNSNRQQRSETSITLKALDFSDDSDHKKDSNGEFTKATLNAGPLPETFTICAAYTADNWTTFASIRFSSIKLNLLTDAGKTWGYVNLFSAETYTQYTIRLGSVLFVKKTKLVFFPQQWTHACLSVDSKVTLVVNGELYGQAEYKVEEDAKRPANLSLMVGMDSLNVQEQECKIADLNVFSPSLALEKMVRVTTAGDEECKTQGNHLRWDAEEWTLHSRAKITEVDSEGPCRKGSQVQVFTADFRNQEDCMRHCQKIAGGRSPKGLIISSHSRLA